jgi:CubicO group peptidase (beta-lactamase class C family)
VSSTQDGTPAALSADGADTVQVDGFVAPGFEPVRDAFVANFTRHGEVGGAFAAYHDGRKVVDLWGGIADKKVMAPYTEDTLQLFFSTTKGVTALCASLLAQRGELDMDAPVSEYWPEFAAAGKKDVPVSDLFSHRVGLPYIDRPLTLEDYLAWEPAVEALAAMEPVWEPGTAHGYHAVTNGYLAGEVIRRAGGRTVGQMVAGELSGPLGLDLWVGLPDAERERVAPLTYSGLRRGSADGESGASDSGDGGAGAGSPVPDLNALIEQFLGPDALLLKALDASPGVFTQRGVFNRPDVLAAEIPSANGVGTARSLAKLYAAVIGPVEGDRRGPGTTTPLLTTDQRAAATTRLRLWSCRA